MIERLHAWQRWSEADQMGWAVWEKAYHSGDCCGLIAWVFAILYVYSVIRAAIAKICTTKFQLVFISWHVSVDIYRLAYISWHLKASLSNFSKNCSRDFLHQEEWSFASTSSVRPIGTQLYTLKCTTKADFMVFVMICWQTPFWDKIPVYIRQIILVLKYANPIRI